MSEGQACWDAQVLSLEQLHLPIASVPSPIAIDAMNTIASLSALCKTVRHPAFDLGAYHSTKTPSNFLISANHNGL